MNRKVLLATIFPAAFFLVFLGVRNADLNKDSRPKPRPRAVLENVEKETKSICHEQHQDAAPPVPVCVLQVTPDFGFPAGEVYAVTFHSVENPVSRAPPYPSVQFS